MLVLSRKKNEKLIIAGGISVTVIDIRGDKVRLGIEAPDEIDVDREEVWEEKQEKGNRRKRRKEEVVAAATAEENATKADVAAA